MKVQFRRERKGEPRRAAVYIDHKLVTFRNETAHYDLAPDRDYVVNWRLIGDTGSSVKVTMTVDGVTKPLFEATLAHADAGRLSDGRILRLKGSPQ